MESVNKLSFFKKLKIIKAEYLVKEAKRHKDNGKFQKAIKKLLKSQKIFDHILKEDLLDIILLSNIGDAYYHMHHYKLALDYFHRAEQKYHIKQLDNNELIYKVNQNIATCYNQLRDYKRYIIYLNKCIEMEADNKKKASLYIELSHSYRILTDFDMALQYSQKALELYQEVYPNESFEIGNGNLSIALVHLDTYNFKEAVTFLERTEEIFENLEVSEKHLVNVYELLEYAFFNLGYKDTAVFYSGKTKRLLKN